jgi:hypothetical protein
MGGLCGGMAPEAPKVDMEKVGNLIETCIKEIPKDVENKENYEFPNEIRKACSENPPKDFQVPDTVPLIKLNDKSSKEEIRKAAVISACGSKLRDQIKEQVWSQVEGEVNEQLNKTSAPQFAKNQALKAAQIPVDKAVDTAIDKVLEKLQTGDKQLDDQEADQIGKEAAEDS